MLAVTATLVACSTIKLAYNNAPSVGYWWLDGYVDFDQAQSMQLRADLARLQLWHRTTELPRYIDLLQQTEHLASTDIDSEQVCSTAQEMRARLKALAMQIEPAATSMAMTLTPVQLQGLERKYARTAARYRKQWLSATPAEQLDKRYKQWLERTEMIYGPLSNAQKDSLRAQLALSGFDARTSYAEQLRRQQDALHTLRQITQEQLSEGDARSLVHGFLERALASPNPVYRAYQQDLLQAGCRTAAMTHNSTTPTQRDIAVQRLRGYEQDLTALAAQQP